MLDPISQTSTLRKLCKVKKSNLYKVHDVCPSLEGDNEEDGDPGQADVVKGDGSVERVRRARRALCVVLVPVHTPLTHLIRLMRRYDLTNKKTTTTTRIKVKTKTKTLGEVLVPVNSPVLVLRLLRIECAFLKLKYKPLLFVFQPCLNIKLSHSG